MAGVLGGSTIKQASDIRVVKAAQESAFRFENDEG